MSVSHAAFEHNERNILRRGARSSFLVPELCKLHALALSIDATRIPGRSPHVCKLYTQQQSKGPCALIMNPGHAWKNELQQLNCFQKHHLPIINKSECIRVRVRGSWKWKSIWVDWTFLQAYNYWISAIFGLRSERTGLVHEIVAKYGLSLKVMCLAFSAWCMHGWFLRGVLFIHISESIIM